MIDEHITQIANSNTFTREEEVKLFEYYNEHHTTEVRNLIAMKNIKLVHKIASKICATSSRSDEEDLVQEGFLGLCRAVEKFDLSTNFRFSTYAHGWIINYMYNYIYEERIISMPRHFATELMKGRKFINKYYHEFGKFPDSILIKEALGITLEKAELIIIYNQDLISLDSEYGSPENDKSLTLLNCLSSEENIENDTINNIINEELMNIIKKSITEKELDILDKRYGITTGDPMTLEEVGKEYGLSRERVRQIQEKAMRKLKNNRKIKMYK